MEWLEMECWRWSGWNGDDGWQWIWLGFVLSFVVVVVVVVICCCVVVVLLCCSLLLFCCCSLLLLLLLLLVCLFVYTLVEKIADHK